MLILTDGDLYPSDLPKTFDVLVECAELPISVIMMGIGNKSKSIFYK